MHAKPQFIKALAVGSTFMTMVSSLAAQTTLQGSATVVRMRGDARYTTAPSNWKPVSVGEVLKPGTIVQTGMSPDSYLDLLLGDGRTPMVGAQLFNPALLAAAGGGASSPGYQPSAGQNVVRVADNTILGIDTLTGVETGADVVTDTQLDLKSGHVFGNVKKMPAASRFEIKLPNGVARIRETTYELWWDGRGEVSAGSMIESLIGKNGIPGTHVIGSDMEFDPVTGKTTRLSDPDHLRNMAKDLAVGKDKSPPSIKTAPDPTRRPVSTPHGPPFDPPGPPPQHPPFNPPGPPTQGPP